MPVHQVLSVTLALFWTVIAEPDAQALLGDDQCEGAGQCALSALQRRGVKKAEDEIRVAEEELAAFIEDSIKAQSLPALEQLNEEVLVNYTHLQSMGCFAKPQEYRLSWRAAGRDFFDQFTFVERDDTHGAQRYLTKEQAFKNHVISISNGGSAILRIGDLIPTGDPGAPYKRNSVMIHSNYAWAPATGMLVVMKYNHVPYGASIWPAFWLMNSDNVWPKGGEFDIMEYANDEASKITFHADRNCMLDNRKLGYCMRGKHMGGPGPSNCNTNYWKNLFGCRPRQVQKNGQWYAKNPGVMAAAWDDEGITVYHIPENRIPADLKDDKPRPEGWGEFVVAYLPMEHHSCKNIAQPQEIVLNIALCGDWAGNGWFRSGEARRTGFTRGCGPLIFEPTRDCCSQFATSRDHRIEDMFRRQAYFDIDYLKVFAPVHAQTPQTSGVKRPRKRRLRHSETAQKTAPSPQRNSGDLKETDFMMQHCRQCWLDPQRPSFPQSEPQKSGDLWRSSTGPLCTSKSCDIYNSLPDFGPRIEPDQVLAWLAWCQDLSGCRGKSERCCTK